MGEYHRTSVGQGPTPTTMSPIRVFRPYSRRMVCVIIVAAILAGCVVASVFMPAYWYMVADAIPQSLSVPSTIRRSSLVFWDRTGATAMVSMI